MPAIQLNLIGFALGVWCAWAARDQLRQAERPWHTPAGFVVWAFAALLFAPACSLLCLSQADWSLGYLISTQRLPNAWPVLMMLNYLVVVPLGFAVCAPRVSENNAILVTRLALVPLGVGTVLLLICLQPLSVVGTTQQYRGEYGMTPVAGSSLGYSVLWFSLVLAASFAWTLWLLRTGAKSFKEHKR